MPDQEGAPPAADSQRSSRGASRNHRRGRGGRGRGRGAEQGARGGRRPSNRNAPRAGPQRSFGGHLTSSADQASSEAPSLSGDAPETAPKREKQSQAKLPKSTAADLATRIHEDISNANYECAICTDEVLRNSSIWSCTVCWTVVHLKCVKKWYDNQKKINQSQPHQSQQEVSWRCPGCNSNLTDEPGSYHCWCGKDINPQPSSRALPPHSCGQTCSKPRGTCPHPCSLQCHSGPCPPCDLMGPEQSCFCGKNASKKLCRETDYENGWSCKETCGDLMPCGEHFCPKPCHLGVCGDCDLKVDARCYCGRAQKQISCFDREEPQQSYSSEKGAWFEGSFSCEAVCAQQFDCGHHKCLKNCHPQDEEPAHCPFSPDVVLRCPCGKTALDKLLDTPRQSCQDPIPHCEEPCLKLLPCGHLCQSKCHTGDCGFCTQRVDIPCRCGRVTTDSLCHQGDLQQPLCMRVCQAHLSCGRHRCTEHCCAGEKKAAERAAAKRKHRVPSQVPAIEAEHICIKTCGRPLKCGNHDCQQICHRGPCGSCPEAIFHEISCDCGRTVLQPPQPCGTRPPECRFDCQRRPSCGHPAVSHNCHPDDVACPKCPFLVEKICACGKEKLHSQPCHLQGAHCGRPCGKKLQCGIHFCKKLCHREGECEDAGRTNKLCGQICGKTKLLCDHACQNPCHGHTPCNESTPCPGKVNLVCPCGLRKQEVKCLTSSLNSNPTRPEMKCDDECLRLDRNRRLAAALNIDPSSRADDHVPYSETTLRLYQESKSWAETQEREFRVFAGSPSEVRMRYKPMPNAQRQFLHVLAEDYGLESRSEDPEPQRYVVVFKGPRFVSAPTKTLSQCVSIRARQAAEAAAAAAASRPPSPPLVPLEPFNSYLLTNPRFGLTIDEIKSLVAADMATQPALHLAIEFLPSDEILMRASAGYSAFMSSPTALEQALSNLKPRLAATVQQHKLAANILLCHVDEAGHVSRRENLARPQDGSGWSAVAGRAAARAATPQAEEPAGARSSGKKLLGLKKKKPDASTSRDKERQWMALDGDVEC
ncbi:putative NF-X1 finger transcription factor [Stachybotrys elegans]|uniref:NF-X1 finger transcription factor n=1 Tax=Stachybotrys elegans TaxID=80388 RepID=A0A8K0T264_9HYPO|nr:putative NF-X1 finger transcription factor [Stachybotrys elegans]